MRYALCNEFSTNSRSAAERGAGEAQGQGLDQLREARASLLRDESAHAVPDQHRRLAAKRLDQPPQGAGDLFQVVGVDQRCAAVTRLVPGVRPVAQCREAGDLTVPSGAPAAMPIAA